MLEWMPSSPGGRLRTDHVGDLRAPVAALRDPAGVAESLHQLDPGVRDVDGAPSGRRRLLRVAVSGHGGDDDVERVGRVAAVGGRVGERADDVEHLDDGPRPAVRDDDRQGVLVRRLHVDEVDVEAVDLGQELREGVEPGLEPAQVVVAAPVAGELLRRRERHALGDVADGLLLRPSRRLDSPAEVVELVLGHLDAEGTDGRLIGGVHRHLRSPFNTDPHFQRRLATRDPHLRISRNRNRTAASGYPGRHPATRPARTRREAMSAFHPELARGRFIPTIPIGPRTSRLMQKAKQKPAGDSRRHAHRGGADSRPGRRRIHPAPHLPAEDASPARRRRCSGCTAAGTCSAAPSRTSTRASRSHASSASP